MKCNVNVLAYLMSFVKHKLIYVLQSTQKKKKKKKVLACVRTPLAVENSLCATSLQQYGRRSVTVKQAELFFGLNRFG